MCARLLGIATARADLLTEPQSRTRFHSECQTSPSKHDQFFVRSTHRYASLIVTLFISFSRSGYPIFVSPLITSYSSTSEPLNDITGCELAWDLIHKKFSTFFQRYSYTLDNAFVPADTETDSFVGHTPSFSLTASEMHQVRTKRFKWLNGELYRHR